MKRFIAVSALVAVCICGSAYGFEFNVRSQSFFRFLHDQNLMSDNKTYVPFYEYLDVGVHDLGVDGLSFHVSGWGRGDLTSRGDGSDRGDGELIYGYIDWRIPKYNFNLKAGRQFITSGPAAMRGRYMDGLSVRSNLLWGFGIEALGGSPVRSAISARSGDVVAQGRLYRKWGKKAELGLSYTNARDDGERDQENIGLDLWLKPTATVEGNLYAFYDILVKGFADAGLGFNYSPMNIPWAFAINYNYVVPSDLLSRTSIFFVFSDTALNNAGFNATYFASRYVTVDANANWYHYSNDTDAARFGADINLRYGYHGRHTAAFGIHRLDEFESGITELRLYNRYFIAKKWSVSGDVYGYIFDDAIRGRSFSFTTVCAMNYQLPKGFTLMAAADFSTNPYFNADLKGIVKLTYNFGGSSAAF